MKLIVVRVEESSVTFLARSVCVEWLEFICSVVLMCEMEMALLTRLSLEILFALSLDGRSQ